MDSFKDLTPTNAYAYYMPSVTIYTLTLYYAFDCGIYHLEIDSKAFAQSKKSADYFASKFRGFGFLAKSEVWT